MGLNRTEVIGHVGADDAKLGKTATKGVSVATFSIAVNQGKGDTAHTLWFKVSIYGSRAEALAPHIRKGQMVYVAGRVGVEGWLSEGAVKTALTLVAGEGRSDFEFLGGGPREEELPAEAEDDGRELIPS